MSNTTSERFPLACPQCHLSSGLPFAASTLTETLLWIRLSVRCTECQHEWCVDQPSRDLAARPERPVAVMSRRP
jgi:hypothetical protein